MDLFRGLFKGDKVIWIIFLVLCLVSIIEVFSASSTLAYKSGNHWTPITSHLKTLTMGVGAVWVIHKIPCRFFKVGIVLYPFSIILLIVVLGTSAINGASRWFNLGFMQFQPSELAKMATIITVSFILARSQEEEQSGEKAIMYIMGVTGLTILCIFTENLSTALLLAISVYLMMIVGRIPLRQMLYLSGVGIGIILIAFCSIKYVPAERWDSIGIHRMVTWQNRLNSHFDKSEIPPEKFDTKGNDAQIAHANIAIATSNIIGKGPGNSVQRDFLSQAYSDFIYAIIIEELGLVGGGIVAFLYIWLLMRIGKIARYCDKPYYTFLIMGIGFLLVTQALFNMMVAVGLMPVTGQPLPLISKGGTSMIINCAYIGIILSISKHVEDIKKQQMEEVLNQQNNITPLLPESVVQPTSDKAKTSPS